MSDVLPSILFCAAVVLVGMGVPWWSLRRAMRREGIVPCLNYLESQLGLLWFLAFCGAPIGFVGAAMAAWRSEVAPLVAACIELGLTIIPRGGGTGYTGSAVPLHADTAVINTEKLEALGQVERRVLPGLSEPVPVVRTECGVVTKRAALCLDCVERLVGEGGTINHIDARDQQKVRIHQEVNGVSGQECDGTLAVEPRGDIVAANVAQICLDEQRARRDGGR